MSSSTPRPGVGMRLNELIERYLAASGGYGESAALGSLGLSRAEAESTLSQFDEDYNISRFFNFQNQAGEAFEINGFPQTHVTIDAAIRSIL